MKTNETFLFGMPSNTMMETALARIGQHWGWIFATGLLYFALGIAAIAMPIASTVGVTFAIAALFLISGCGQLVQAFRLRHELGATTRFLQSLLSLLVGGLIIRYPAGGMLSITLVLSFYFFIAAAMQWFVYTAARPLRYSGLLLVSSIATFLLGVFLIATMPVSALWIPGALLGIDFLVSGAALMAFSVSARQAHLQGREAEDLRAHAS